MMAFSCNRGGDEPDTPVTPGAPQNLKLHESTKTSLSFQWNQVDGAASYSWKLLKGTVQVADGVVKSRNVVIEGLEPATSYTFKVRSVGASGSTSAETSLDAQTEGEVTPVDPPVTPPVDPVDPSEAYAMFMIPEWEDADGLARAFPGAEGGGMWTTGGRGGSVYHVTSLEDTNTQGTLRYGVQTLSGPRIIVFDVAGTISLTSQLQVKKGDVYIAGQTAPGDGICLKDNTFRVSASNVIVRFIRCRMGDATKVENDAMQVMDDDDKFTNIIIDHCSVSWSTDECASFYGQKNFTFQWNIVSESLRNSIHGKGSHGYGGIWGGTNSSYHHNLLAHHDSRNPRIDHDYVSTQKGPVHIFNNVVYNWRGNTCYGGESSSKNGSNYRKYNFFNNYYKPGPATPSDHIWFLDPTTSCSNCGGTILPGHFYMAGNYMYGKNWTDNNWTTASVHADQEVIDKIKESEPFHTDDYQSVHNGEGCLDPVLDYAGASLKRDRIDTRIATETRNGTYTYKGSNGSTNGLIDTQTDVGGWPTYSAGDETVVDTDRDGMPDWFEDMFGLDKSSSADAKTITLDKKGRYTNLEMYLHYIVRNIVAQQNANANYTKL